MRSRSPTRLGRRSRSARASRIEALEARVLLSGEPFNSYTSNLLPPYLLHESFEEDGGKDERPDPGEEPEPDPSTGPFLAQGNTFSTLSAPAGPFGAASLFPNVLVNDPAADGTAQNTQSETTLAVLGGTVVVGFNDSGSFLNGLPQFTGFSRSTDGGASFTDGGSLPVSTDGDAGDPVLAYDGAVRGRLYFSTLSFNGTGIPIFRSDDGGATWQAPVNAFPGQPTGDFLDKEWIAVDNNAGPGAGNLYAVTRDFGPIGSPSNGIWFTRTTDGGDTFAPAIQIASAGFSNVQGPFVTVGPDHNVYVAYFDQRTFPNSLKLRVSTDQGATFGPEQTIATLNTTSSNGDLGLAFRSNSFPQMAVNPANGDLYVLYNDDPPGADRADVFLTTSSDGGATWSTPERVNDDATTNDQWQPALTVAPDGQTVGVFWYDRRRDPADTLIDYYGAIGTVAADGSISFSDNFRITDTAFSPVFGLDPVVNPSYMGDYDQAAADAGNLYVSWGDNRLGSPDVRMTTISQGFQVVTTTPETGTVVDAPAPTEFTVGLSSNYDPATVQAGDFTVNGVPASGVVAVDANTLTFTYATSPVGTDGPQTMAIAAGAIARDSDGAPWRPSRPPSATTA